MALGLHFTGPARYRLRSLATMVGSAAKVWLRRSQAGPTLPGWNWELEVRTEILQRQLATAFNMRDPKEARRYLDTILIDSPDLPRVTVQPVVAGHVRGSWFVPRGKSPARTLLFLHGGGYSFYPRAYAGLIASITLAAKSRTFALDYRLAPEHRFPAQLEDAVNAYRWLLRSRVDPQTLVVAGDSAGGNLALALLLRAREQQLPLPALTVVLSPATDFRANISGQPAHDWINFQMLTRWADWFCAPEERGHPTVSPCSADLRGLSAIYVQAGGAEILYESIQEFVQRARSQGVSITLETWDGMPHDFQFLGPELPQGGEAIKKIGEMIKLHLPTVCPEKAVSAADR
jgi:epsilon-lactone hydrolase